MLGQFLFELEQLYGPRDTSFTPLGIEFFGEVPQIWFPQDRRHVAIRLTEGASNDVAQALFQLAHEAVHLLEPVLLGHTNVAEEGLATAYSMEVSARLCLNMHADDNRYLQAQGTILEWFKIDPSCILKTRNAERPFHKWTPELILSAVPTTPPELAQALCRPFS